MSCYTFLQHLQPLVPLDMRNSGIIGRESESESKSKSESELRTEPEPDSKLQPPPCLFQIGAVTADQPLDVLYQTTKHLLMQMPDTVVRDNAHTDDVHRSMSDTYDQIITFAFDHVIQMHLHGTSLPQPAQGSAVQFQLISGDRRAYFHWFEFMTHQYPKSWTIQCHPKHRNPAFALPELDSDSFNHFDKSKMPETMQMILSMAAAPQVDVSTQMFDNMVEWRRLICPYFTRQNWETILQQADRNGYQCILDSLIMLESDPRVQSQSRFAKVISPYLSAWQNKNRAFRAGFADLIQSYIMKLSQRLNGQCHMIQ